MKRIVVFVSLALMLMVLMGCAPKMTVVEQGSSLLPGVTYVGAYIKHPTGMNVSRIDQFQDGKCQHPGNTVHDTGIVNNATKGAVAAGLQAGGFIGGMLLRNPDTYRTTNNTNVSGTSGSSGSSAGAIAGAGAAAGAAAGVANFNSNAQAQGQNQGQGQGQLQGQGQAQGQHQGQGVTDGNFSPQSNF